MSSIDRDNGWSHIKPPIIVKTILPMPHHYFLTMSAATILFLTICATAPLSLSIIRGVHPIILPAWRRRNSTEDVVVSIDSDLIFVDGLLYFSCPPEIVAEVYLPLLFHRTPDSHFGGGIRSVEIVELDRTFWYLDRELAGDVTAGAHSDFVINARPYRIATTARSPLDPSRMET